MDVITNSLNGGQSVDVVFLDFAKAFDKVSHPKLLLKLAAYGLGPIIVNWIKSFLNNRRQRVVIGNKYSQWETVLSGVPQGTVLEPVLFTILINDLPAGVKNVCELYADDCKLIATIETPYSSINLQSDINSLQEWAIAWQCTFNCKKCKVMHLGKRNSRFNYTMMDGKGNSIVLEKTELEKDLGVMISSNLDWSDI